MSVTIKDSLAKIAISKNLIKEYKSSESERTVYLNDGTEFQIHLKNPYQDHLGIKIYVNNKSIGNMLVLKPGQSCWLDRFVNEKKRFLFSTYEVENTGEMRYAINKNGRVKIEFYHEKEETSSLTWGPYYKSYHIDGPYYNFYSTSTGYVSNVNSVNTMLNSVVDVNNSYTGSAPISTSELSSSASTIELNATVPDKPKRKGLTRQEIDCTIETGRVEKGSVSNQEFETCDISFQYWPFKTEEILILPNSRKQIRVEDTRRRYCSQCGKKVSPKDKFCSNCGARLN